MKFKQCLFQQGHSTVLNPVYGAPVQSTPTFFNPSQFQNSSQSFPSTPSNPYAQAPIGSNIGRISSSRSSPSCQLPPVCQESFNAVPEPTGSATLSPVQMSISPLTNRTSQETVPPSLQNLVSDYFTHKWKIFGNRDDDRLCFWYFRQQVFQKNKCCTARFTTTGFTAARWKLRPYGFHSPCTTVWTSRKFTIPTRSARRRKSLPMEVDTTWKS